MKPTKISALLLALLLLLAACTTSPGPAAQTDVPPIGTDAPLESGTEPAQSASAETETAPETETPPFGPIETEVPPEERPPVEMEELQDPYPARDYAQVLDFLGSYDYYAVPSRDPGEEGPDLPGGDSGIELMGIETESAGVVRPERICADGAYLYLLDSYGLTILSAEGKNSRMLCNIPIEREANSYLEEMFVSGDRAGVIYTCSSFGEDDNGNWYDVNSTHLVVYDVSDRTNPVRLRDSGVEGSFLHARMVGDTVYLLTNRYFWSVDPNGAPESVAPSVIREGKSEKIPAERIWICPNPNSTALTVAAAVSLESGEILDSAAFTDATASVLVEPDAIWLGRSVREYGVSASYTDGDYKVTDHAARTMTELKRLSLEEGLSLAWTARMDGAIVCPTGLGRTEAGLCTVTGGQELHWSTYSDEARGFSNISWGETRLVGGLTILDAENQRTEVEAPALGEAQISACRYSGSLMLMVTNRGILPADLSDKEDPKLLEALPDLEPDEIPTFLTDGSFLCIGTGEAGLRLRLFRQKEDGAIETVAETELPEVSGTPAQTDGSLLLLDEEAAWIGFSAEGSAETGYRYYLTPLKAEGFGDPKMFELSYLPTNAKGLLLDGVLYICSAGTTYAADPASGKILTTVTNAEG